MGYIKGKEFLGTDDLDDYSIEMFKELDILFRGASAKDKPDQKMCGPLNFEATDSYVIHDYLKMSKDADPDIK